jgi:hypothetical protein
VSRGVFIDGPVGGLTYRATSITGKTEADGAFNFVAGESVTFFSGDIIIGTATGRSMLTPLDLVANGSDTDPTVLNIARFLQTIDSDGDHHNGIEITAIADAILKNKSLDFTKNLTDFNDEGLRLIFAELSASGAFRDATERALVTSLAAQANLRRSLNPAVDPFQGNWSGMYTAPVASGSSGLIISVGPPLIDEIDSPTVVDIGGRIATIAISDSVVTFSPTSGTTITGSISESGIITLPDRTAAGCKDPFGQPVLLSSVLVLDTDGVIHAEWQIATPLPWPGYCSRDLIKVDFNPGLRNSGLLVPTQISPTENFPPIVTSHD